MSILPGIKSLGSLNLKQVYTTVYNCVYIKGGKSFIKKRVTEKSRHFMSALFSGQNSEECSRLIILHFCIHGISYVYSYIHIFIRINIYSFASWQNRLFGFFFGPSSVKRGRTHIVLGWSVSPPLHTLKIWGAGVYSPRSYGAEFVFFCLSFTLYARHRKPRRFVYALNLGGTGISRRDKIPPRAKDPRGKSAQRRHILLQR